MKDALRYRKKRMGGKSGDSGDDLSIDEIADDPELNAFAFLLPTSSRFPRETTVLGGSAGAPNDRFTKARTPTNVTTDEDSTKFPFDEDDASTPTKAVYAYVCI